MTSTARVAGSGVTRKSSSRNVDGLLPVPVVNMAPLSEPFMAALLAWWILHQAPSPWVWLGGALVAAGGVIALLRERRVVEEPT